MLCIIRAITVRATCTARRFMTGLLTVLSPEKKRTADLAAEGIVLSPIQGTSHEQRVKLFDQRCAVCQTVCRRSRDEPDLLLRGQAISDHRGRNR